jgi:site-specific recombinase XerD
MNVYYTYGRNKSDSKKKERTIYARISYGRNKLQVNASTKLIIPKHGWNFKKGEEAGVVNLMSGSRSVEDSQYFQQVKEKLEHIRSHLKNEFRQLKLKAEYNFYTQQEWNAWGKEHFEIAIGERKAKSEKAPLFMEKFKEYEETEKRKWATKTIQGYKTIRNKLNDFESDSRQYRTDEIDLTYYNDFQEWCYGVKDHKPSTFGGYIAKIKTVINHFRSIEPNFKFHVNIDHKNFYAPDEVKEKEFLEEHELELLWNYKGSKKLENTRDIAKLLYYVCLRWNEFRYEFKTNEDNPLKIYKTEDNFLWEIYEQKVKHRKGLPLHSKLVKMYEAEALPYYIEIGNFNKYILELLQSIGISKHITSHCFRKSFCVNHYINGMTEEDIMEYSGHKSVKSLRAYINIDTVKRNNAIPTK